MHYKYVIDLDERGQFQAHVEDHGGKTVWEVSYPEYYQDDETGEEMENSTIFDDGYMSDTDDVEGLEKYLKQVGIMPKEAELKSEEEFEEEDDDEDEFAEGGYNPAQEIIDSIYGSAGKVYRVVADIGDDKVGMTAYYTKAVIEDVIKEITDKGYKIINVEEKDDSYMEGGEISEYKGTKSFTVNFKTYRNFPAAWRVIFFWGGTKPFVEVTKVTNNPFGGRLGTDFETLDKAIAHYKSPEMKVLLMQAADVAKKAGVPMDMFAYGGMMKDGGEITKATLLLVDATNPLSSQVQKITGDPLNTGDYKDVGVGNFNILTHKKSGKVFVVYPTRIFSQLPEDAVKDDFDYLKNVEKISFASGGEFPKIQSQKDFPYYKDLESKLAHAKKYNPKKIPEIKKKMREWENAPMSKMARGGMAKVDRKYTHFAVGKNDGKIVTGWEYKGLDNDEIKNYTKMDLGDMDLKYSDYRIVTAKKLKSEGIDPFSWDNWRKTEQMAKGGVIGSSPTKEGIEKVIGKYYFSSNISLHQRGDTNEYDVHNAKGKVNGVKVVEKKGRYQFVEDNNKMADGGKLANGKYKYEKGDEGMYEGDEVRVVKLHIGRGIYEYNILDEDGKVKTHGAAPKSKFERQFRYFPKMKGGGKTKSFKEMTFKEKSASIQAKLKGSKVSPKYRKQYGKTYDSAEAKEAADAITGKIVSKMKE